MNSKIYQNIEVKIILLEIKPSLKTLETNSEEISIIFQGINVVYNLKKLLLSKTEIIINNCKNSILISLIKSDNIFATSLFNITYGEQWIYFNYDLKNSSIINLNKKTINNRIKIKIKCDQKIKINNFLFKIKNKSPKIILNNNNNIINSKNSNIKRYNTNVINQKNFSKKNNNLNKNKLNNISTDIKKNIRNSFELGKPNSNSVLKKVKNEKIKYYCPGIKTRNNNIQFLSFRNSELTTFSHSKLDIPNSSNNNSANKSNIYNFNSYKSNSKMRHKTKNQINIKDFSKFNNFNNYLQINSSINNLKNNFGLNNFNMNENLKMKLEQSINDLNNILEKNKNTNDSNYTNNKKNLKNSKKNIYFSNNLPMNTENNKIISKTKKNSINNSVNLNNSNNYDNNLLFGFNKSNDKNKKIIKNNILTKKGIPINTTNSYSISTIKKNNTSLNILADNEEKNNNKYKNKNRQHPLSSKRTNLKQIISHKKNSKSLNYMQGIILNTNVEKHKNEENDLNYLDIKDNLIEDSYDNFREFTKLKNNINLIYNKLYIKNIKEDLLKLELEIFVEKMYELIMVYHNIINEEKIKNEIAQKNYEENRSKYIYLYKLNNKLKIINYKYESKKINLNKNKKSIKIQKENNLFLNKIEFNIFENIVNSNNENKKFNKNKTLKEILSIILNNEKNKNIIEDNKFKLWLKTNQKNQIEEKTIKVETIDKKVRTKPIPKRQKTKIFSTMNKNEGVGKKSEKKILSLSINDICNDLRNNSLNFNLKTEIYRKKAPKSPLYYKNNKLNKRKNNISLSPRIK